MFRNLLPISEHMAPFPAGDIALSCTGLRTFSISAKHQRGHFLPQSGQPPPSDTAWHPSGQPEHTACKRDQSHVFKHQLKLSILHFVDSWAVPWKDTLDDLLSICFCTFLRHGKSKDWIPVPYPPHFLKAFNAALNFCFIFFFFLNDVLQDAYVK